MAALRRTEAGNYRIKDSITLSALESLSEEQRLQALMPVESLFEDLPALSLPPFYGKLASAGCPIYLKKIGESFPQGQRLRLYRNGMFFALGQVDEHPEGMAVKALKQFVLFKDQ